MASRAPRRGAPAKTGTRSTVAVAKSEEQRELGLSARTISVNRDAILKAAAREEAHAQGNPDEADNRIWEGIGALVPPYEPYVLLTLLEHSNSLRQCVDGYVTNIDGGGHRFEPIIDLNASDADDRIKTYLINRAAARQPDVVLDPATQVPEPTADQVEAAKRELGERMRMEKVYLEHFFEYACLDYSFVTLRRQTRQDIETQGNGYWECIKDESGQTAGFSYIPAFTMRHFAADKFATPVTVRVKKNEFEFDTLETRKCFRRFVQVFESRTIWFKELGDPRVVSRKDGCYFPPGEEGLRLLKKRDPQDSPASEVIHFRVHTSKSSYGIPRWVGCLLSVLGSRHAEEVNLSYFENKSVPPLAVIVNGGRISNQTVNRIKDFIENDIKGKKNFHKILVLEGENMGGSFDQGRLKIDLKPLTAAQHNDALFQNYDERNIDKVGQAFRLPRMLRGDIRDFNRATADAAIQFAETQVFRPERDEFDFMINRKVLPMLGARFWRFRSNGAANIAPYDLAEILGKLATPGFITPAEGRELMEQIFNRPFARINAPWVNQPLTLSMGGIAPAGELIAPNMGTPQDAAYGPSENTPTLPTPSLAAESAGTAPAAGAVGSVATGDFEVKLTGTDMASIYTVNEARGKQAGPLLLANGQPDPDGYLTVTEFKAKRLARADVVGTAAGERAAGAAGTGASAPTPQDKAMELVSGLLSLRKALEKRDLEEALANHEAARDLDKGFPG